jgi:hypothetical protein
MFENDEPVRVRWFRTLIASAAYTEVFWIASKLAVTPPALRGTWKGKALFTFYAYGVPFLGASLAVFFELLEKWEAVWMVAPSYLVLLRVNWAITPFPFRYALVCGCDMWLSNAAGIIAALALRGKLSKKE